MTSRNTDSNPQGRRYVLKNFNARKKKQINLEKKKEQNKDYYDLRMTPSSMGSTSYRSNKLTGSSNKVMPSEKQSPRKETTREKGGKKQEAKSPRKKGDEVALLSSRSNGKGLTPRDEYMVTKLYDKEIIYLKPSEVRYTHDQISAHFTDGRSLLSTFVALLYEKVEIKLGTNDVPPIEVMQTSEYEGGRECKMWFVVNGNRRLFVFRRLEKCGAITTMQVIARRYDSLEMDKHFLTRNKGRTVSVTNDASLNAKIAKEVKQWKEWKVKQPKKKGGKGKGRKKTSDGTNANSK